METSAATPPDDLLREAARVGADPPPPQPLRGRELRRHWHRWAALGVLIGLAVPVAVIAAVDAGDASPGYIVLATALAGAAAGICIGVGEALVLRRALPVLSAGAWIRATALAAALGVLVAAVPLASGLTERRGLEGTEIAAFAVACFLAVLAIGTAQWLELRHTVVHASRWAVANAIAWVVGLAVPLAVAVVLWSEGTATVASVVLIVVSLLVAAASVAYITGIALSALLREDDQARARQRADYAAEAAWLLRTVAEAKKRARRERLRSMARRGL